ncbi:hypothetical protein Thiowin_04541 [Thiorhodovibrio winogradskyi]|uniref:Ribbon-helix-helix protein CopG domain-containing protein n=1 Tax=Thiorhodovibrio winogradskyi TaxID=77007 RepID=A0ABZ0SJ19_9GAMM
MPPLTVRLTPAEESLLDAVSRRSARSQDDLIRQGIRELCLPSRTGHVPHPDVDDVDEWLKRAGRGEYPVPPRRICTRMFCRR